MASDDWDRSEISQLYEDCNFFKANIVNQIVLSWTRTNGKRFKVHTNSFLFTDYIDC